MSVQVAILLPPNWWIERASELLLAGCQLGILSSHKDLVTVGWQCVYLGGMSSVLWILCFFLLTLIWLADAFA